MKGMAMSLLVLGASERQDEGRDIGEVEVMG